MVCRKFRRREIVEVSPEILLGGVTVLVGAIGGVIGYGELKTKVVSLEQRASNAREDRQNLFLRVNDIEKQTEVQEKEIEVLTKNQNDLSDVVQQQVSITNDLSSTLKVMANDIHSIKKYVDGVQGIKKSD
jgi:hypothetical protein